MDVFCVDSMSDGKVHLGTKGRIPLCGNRLVSPKLTNILRRLNRGNVLEIKFTDTIQKAKWLNEFSNQSKYCKSCLKQFNIINRK